MASRRRKTLSHSEIENFLSDLNTPADADPIKRQSVVSSSHIHVDLGIDIDTKFSVSTGVDFCSPSVFPMSVDNERRELVRKFCKMTMNGVAEASGTQEAVKDLAFRLLDLSNYKLISTRIYSEDATKHPAGSIESKKALLISLSPMLTEAEEERKKETQACEAFTRCRANKVRTRGSNYEYIDVDTNMKVDYDEYESRYMLFINRNKVAVSPPSVSVSVSTAVSMTNLSATNILPAEVAPLDPVHKTKVTPGPETAAPTDDKENTVEVAPFKDLPENTPVNILSPKYASKKACHNDRKRKHEPADLSARRGTLSPSSMKAILLASLKEPVQETEEIAKLNSMVAKIESTSAGTGVSTPRPCEDVDRSCGDVSTQECDDYMDCDVSVSFSKSTKDKRKGGRWRNTLSPSGLSRMSRRPSLLLSALETGMDDGSALQSVEALSSSPPCHAFDENLRLEVYQDSQGMDVDVDVHVHIAANTHTHDAVHRTPAKAAESLLLDHLMGEDDATKDDVAVDGAWESMELDESIRSRANSLVVAQHSSPTFSRALTSEPVEVGSDDSLLHSISPDGILSTKEEEAEEREELEIPFAVCDELDEIVRERSESPVQELLSAVSPEDCDPTALGPEHTPSLVGGAEKEVLEEEQSLVPILELEVALPQQRLSPVTTPVKEAPHIVEAEALETVVDAEENDVFDTVCAPPLTPLPPALSSASLSQPSPFTSYFGQRSALQSLIHEALNIILPHHPSDAPIGITPSMEGDDVRTFQLIEELVWQHVNSGCASNDQREGVTGLGVRTVSIGSSCGDAAVAAEEENGPLLGSPVQASPYKSVRGLATDLPAQLLYNPADVPMLVDETEAEQSAHRRLRERMAEVRCRYVWEVVSTQAANASIRRMHEHLLGAPLPQQQQNQECE